MCNYEKKNPQRFKLNFMALKKETDPYTVEQYTFVQVF